MNKEVERIRRKISKWQKELYFYQDSICEHKDVVKKAGASTGGYDPNDDRYWYDYDCPDCGKHWRVDQ